MTNTFGLAYEAAVDEKRIGAQMRAVLFTMLGPWKEGETIGGLRAALQASCWWTLGELREATGYPEASISAQLRHLRKKEFGAYVVEKRRREYSICADGPKCRQHKATGGTWEYRIRRPEKQMSLYAHLPGCATHP